MFVTGAGALPEGRAEANCPGSQALDTPQNQALHSHLPSIISLISSDVVNVAGLMSQHKLIPRQLYERTVQVTGIDNHVKATELMITISAQVKINRSTFNTFLKVLENAGDYTANLIEQLKSKDFLFEPLLKPNNVSFSSHCLSPATSTKCRCSTSFSEKNN